MADNHTTPNTNSFKHKVGKIITDTSVKLDVNDRARPRTRSSRWDLKEYVGNVKLKQEREDTEKKSANQCHSLAPNCPITKQFSIIVDDLCKNLSLVNGLDSICNGDIADCKNRGKNGENKFENSTEISICNGETADNKNRGENCENKFENSTEISICNGETADNKNRGENGEYKFENSTEISIIKEGDDRNNFNNKNDNFEESVSIKNKSPSNFPKRKIITKADLKKLGVVLTEDHSGFNFNDLYPYLTEFSPFINFCSNVCNNKDVTNLKAFKTEEKIVEDKKVNKIIMDPIKFDTLELRIDDYTSIPYNEVSFPDIYDGDVNINIIADTDSICYDESDMPDIEDVILKDDPNNIKTFQSDSDSDFQKFANSDEDLGLHGTHVFENSEVSNLQNIDPMYSDENSEKTDIQVSINSRDTNNVLKNNSNSIMTELSSEDINKLSKIDLKSISNDLIFIQQNFNKNQISFDLKEPKIENLEAGLDSVLNKLPNSSIPMDITFDENISTDIPVSTNKRKNGKFYKIKTTSKYVRTNSNARKSVVEEGSSEISDVSYLLDEPVINKVETECSNALISSQTGTYSSSSNADTIVPDSNNLNPVFISEIVNHEHITGSVTISCSSEPYRDNLPDFENIKNESDVKCEISSVSAENELLMVGKQEAREIVKEEQLPDMQPVAVSCSSEPELLDIENIKKCLESDSKSEINSISADNELLMVGKEEACELVAVDNEVTSTIFCSLDTSHNKSAELTKNKFQETQIFPAENSITEECIVGSQICDDDKGIAIIDDEEKSTCKLDECKTDDEKNSEQQKLVISCDNKISLMKSEIIDFNDSIKSDDEKNLQQQNLDISCDKSASSIKLEINYNDVVNIIIPEESTDITETNEFNKTCIFGITENEVHIQQKSRDEVQIEQKLNSSDFQSADSTINGDITPEIDQISEQSASLISEISVGERVNSRPCLNRRASRRLMNKIKIKVDAKEPIIKNKENEPDTAKNKNSRKDVSSTKSNKSKISDFGIKNNLFKSKAEKLVLDSLSDKSLSSSGAVRLKSKQKSSKIVADYVDPRENDDIMKSFVQIDDNEYTVERSICKEAKRVVCDCFVTAEEIERGEIGCGDDCLNRLLLIECGSRCVLGVHCSNKRFQKREYINCEVVKTEGKGYGVRSLQNVPSGTFVMEYVGEVVDSKEFSRRVAQYARESNPHHYFMSFQSDNIIDATIKGNISRFINHSCDPNAETQKWTVNGELHIGFFTKKDINIGEEITFDYQYQRFGKQAEKCMCGSSICRGWIGMVDPVDEDDVSDEENVTVYADISGKWESILDDISETGLVDRDQTLNLNRMMVYVKSLPARLQILKLLQEANAVCKKLFIDYHGLPLLWSWMVDTNNITDPQESEDFRIQILKALNSLNISNKTLLMDSKVLTIVEQWANSLLSLESASAADTADATTSVNESGGEAVENKDENVKSLAKNLLSVWSALKDTFRIPKKERIIQMKEHEMEADRSRPVLQREKTHISKVGVITTVLRSSKYGICWDGQSRKSRKKQYWSDRYRSNRSFNNYQSHSNVEHDQMKTSYSYGGAYDETYPNKNYEQQFAGQQYDEQARNITVLTDAANYPPPPPPPPTAEDPYYDPSYNQYVYTQSMQSYGQPAYPYVQYVNPVDNSSYLHPTSYGEPQYMQSSEPCMQPVAYSQYPEQYAYATQSYQAEYTDAHAQDTTTQFYYENPELVQSFATVDNSFEQQTSMYIPLEELENIPLPGQIENVDSSQLYDPLNAGASSDEEGDLNNVPLYAEVTDLPPKWRSARDAKGRLYYYHIKTKVPQWYPPTVEQCAGDDSPTEFDVSDSGSSSTDEEEDDINLYLPNYTDTDTQITTISEQQNEVATSYVEMDDDIKENLAAMSAEFQDTDSEGYSPVIPQSNTTGEKQLVEKHEEGVTENVVTEQPPLPKVPRPRSSSKHKRKHKLRAKNSSSAGHGSERITTSDKTSTATADTSSVLEQRIKENFRSAMASYVVFCLKPFYQATCKQGRIANESDFKHLARKLTYFVMVKEQQQCGDAMNLMFSSSVKRKTKNYIRKYMGKYEECYVRPASDPQY